MMVRNTQVFLIHHTSGKGERNVIPAVNGNPAGAAGDTGGGGLRDDPRGGRSRKGRGAAYRLLVALGHL